MTTAPQLSVGTTLAVEDDVSYSVFQNVIAPAATELVCGNIFMGLQGYVAVRIPLGEQLGLARGGRIETGLTNAALTMRATRNWGAGGEISVNACVDDSPRAGPLDPRLAWKPPAGFGPDWRRDTWGTFRTRLEDTGGSPLIDIGTSTNASWAIRQTAGARERLAALFTVPAGPSISVARAILELAKNGSPSGSMEVAIQANSTDAYGRSIPDGTDLGVSSAVANSGIPAGPSNITFPFSPDVVLAPGSYWAILRPSTPYSVDGTNYISWRQNRNFFNVQGAHYSTNSAKFVRGNYPGHVDVALDLNAKAVGTAITWSVPATSVGQSRSTPDLSPLIQEVILNSGHETASAICIFLSTVSQTITFGFAAQGHPTLAPPGFACQFRRRDHRGGVL